MYVLGRQCVEAQRQAEQIGRPSPVAYFRNELDFERMCDEQDLDLIYTATP